MSDRLLEFIGRTIDEWEDRLEEMEVHYNEDNDLVDNQKAKNDLLKDMRNMRSRLESLD